MFAADPGLEEVRGLLGAADPERMTPLEALLFVQKLKLAAG
jgi:hypothetical protein